ncbi:MAG TPA: response regulator [Candidatus Wolfebacteria bacterium]|nr:response regulator [Candidatus Wolfebacteria bacterium]
MAKNQPKILLVEDEPDIVEMYKMVFRENGFDFDSALTGNEAKKKIKEISDGKKTKPAFILLDLVLPDITGIDVLKEIRNNEATKDILVAILSNYTSEKAKESSQDLKVDEYILKVDITPQELVEKIKKILNFSDEDKSISSGKS